MKFCGWIDLIKRSAVHMNHNSCLLYFYTPVEDGTYYGITRGGWASGWAGSVPHSLSGAYLQDYASYSYEISWVDRSHQGGVQCLGTITLACLIFELLPFAVFHT